MLGEPWLVARRAMTGAHRGAHGTLEVDLRIWHDAVWWSSLRGCGAMRVRDRRPAESAIRKDDTPRVGIKRRVNVYSTDETEMLVLAAEMASPRWHMLMLSLVDTGMRVGEALRLEWPMLRLDHVPPQYVLPSTATNWPESQSRQPRLQPRTETRWRHQGCERA